MHSETADAAGMLDVVIRSRKSVRAFRSDQVSKLQLMEILEMARAAPSNFNSQPWRVYVLTGKAKHALGEAILQAHIANTVAAILAISPTYATELQGAAGGLWAALLLGAGHRPRGYGSPRAPNWSQLCVFRCACRPDLHDPCERSRSTAGLTTASSCRL